MANVNMQWINAVRKITPFVVKIQTPRGYGTGFLFAFNNDGNVAAIVTALHVVQSADEWKEPIKLALEGKEAIFVPAADRVVFIDADRDSASILVPSAIMEFPKTLLTLCPKEKYQAPGSPVGWLGYPAIAPNKLCFFKGHTSAFEEKGDYYLVDGVAINGVSGGPVFDSEDEPTLLGTVSAYSYNLQRGAALPGLLVAHDLTHAHDAIAKIKSFDEAREIKESQPQTSSAASQTPASPGPSESPMAPPPSNPPTGLPGPAAPHRPPGIGRSTDPFGKPPEKD